MLEGWDSLRGKDFATAIDRLLKYVESDHDGDIAKTADVLLR